MTRVIGRLKDTYLATDKEGSLSPLDFATRWDGEKWVGWARIGSWVKNVYGLSYEPIDKAPAQLGLPEPDFATLKQEYGDER